MQSIYEMTKDIPAFKSFCRRRSTVKRESWETTFAKLRKKRASEFKSFCKSRGINSILKDNEFTTGYVGDTYGIERARMVKVKGEFICKIEIDAEEMLRRLINDYQRAIDKAEQIKNLLNEESNELNQLTREAA